MDTSSPDQTTTEPVQERLQRPETFNFAIDVVDHWAVQPGNINALHWVAQDESSVQILTYKYFSRRSQQISVLLQQCGIKNRDTLILILPRIPAW
jgi:acyl-coenzyme A synthetase/AMP-(fatty) acid ligase